MNQHIWFKEPRVRCFELEDIIRRRPVRCKFLCVHDDMYSCKLNGFVVEADSTHGKVKVTDDKVLYDYDKISNEKISKVNLCLYRFAFFIYEIKKLLSFAKDVKSIVK